MLQKIPKYLQPTHDIIFKNRLYFQLEALSNCEKYIVITIYSNNDVLTWNYQENKYNKSNNVKVNK